MRLLAVPMLLAMLMGTGVPAMASEKLYFYTENYPPYNMSATGRAFEHSADQIDGLCTDLVEAIMANTSLDFVIKLRNWDYGYQRALNKPNHGVFCTAYNDERAGQFKWVGPLTTVAWTVFGKAGTDITLNSLDDAKGYSFGGYRNDIMTDFLKERGFKMSELDSNDLNPRRLALGQIDLWLVDRLTGYYLASQQDVEDIEELYSFNETELYLALNPDTPDEVVQTLEMALEQVHQSGMFSAISDRYGL
ncbi:substrate-binding periplasmic protein [Marinobacter xestospongiae]|uniref:Transporter substrate-binding domain-containing protein n=1 Tax=Marinobacter xestospongiae TaxID=994319 RepID=A0ABU3VZE4_9GAMM|nr:transporter substrate-binding domain-containing protein [Marinobacter xestospongiae]MDV2079647.1 transporter substrate-binding domain-containing protein [Marinobacter xestospongiae]